MRWFHEEHGMTISPYDTRFAGRHTPGLQIHDPVGDDEMMSRCMQGFWAHFRKFAGMCWVLKQTANST